MTRKPTRFPRSGVLCAIGLFALSFTPNAVNAEITIDIFEENGDVIALLFGTLDFDDQEVFTFGVGGFNGLSAVEGSLSFAGNGVPVDPYRTADFLTPFGTSSFQTWDSQSGDPVAFFGDLAIGVPPGYVSGDLLSSRAAKSNATLSSLGLTPGSFTTNFVNSGFTDSLTVNVGPVNSVPEPSSAIVFLALSGTLLARRR
ncbi:PEP-CTERM sorting domain-containing protein, partial [Mariniblastus sp.]|nr:PEP-CTERM sorting domain-containing protein [Mariniblastus sp.]